MEHKECTSPENCDCPRCERHLKWIENAMANPITNVWCGTCSSFVEPPAGKPCDKEKCCRAIKTRIPLPEAKVLKWIDCRKEIPRIPIGHEYSEMVLLFLVCDQRGPLITEGYLCRKGMREDPIGRIKPTYIVCNNQKKWCIEYDEDQLCDARVRAWSRIPMPKFLDWQGDYDDAKRG